MAEPKKKTPPPPPENGNEGSEAPKFGAKEIFDEWRVDVPVIGEADKVEKVKILRKGVKITPEQAEILNDGVLWGNNRQGVMYFKPE